MKRSRVGSIAVLLYASTVAGCSTIDWAMTDEESIAEAIFQTAPFSMPQSIEVEARVAGACQDIHTPAVWSDLMAARLGATRQETPSTCELVPVGRAATQGSQVAWERTRNGDRWRIPVGMYGIHGTHDDAMIMTRSRTGRPSVDFAWRFRSFSNLRNVAAAREIAEATGSRGNAHAVFARTENGWKVVSLALSE